jgi:hypothetical protein
VTSASIVSPSGGSSSGPYPDIHTLAIDLDGGSAVSSNRTQFIKRMVQFARATGLRIQLIDYPPDHSKYNPIVGFAFPKGTMLGRLGTLLEWPASHHA